MTLHVWCLLVLFLFREGYWFDGVNTQFCPGKFKIIKKNVSTIKNNNHNKKTEEKIIK